jgi:hypothetical protein
LKAIRALYISKAKSTHDKRFVEAFRQLVQLDELYLNEFNPLVESSIFADRTLIIASPLSTGLSSIPVKSDARIVGISMAYEINEESKEPPAFEEIKKNVKRCIAIVCDCQQIENELRNRFNFAGPILRIAYGCSQKDFLGIKLQDREKLRIVSTRNWTQIHSNETSLEALSMVKIKSREHFQEAISFSGPYAQDDLPSIFTNSEIYISTSISDGSSVSLLEAMSAGRICIGRDFPSNNEWIQHGRNGFLFSSTEDLAQILVEISKLTFAEKKLISEAARKSVTGRADWDLMREALIHFGKQWAVL